MYMARARGVISAMQTDKLMTVDEFLTWEDGTDVRYELMDGVVRAVTPLCNAEGTIKVSTAAIVHTALRGRRGCHAEISPVVRISDRTMWLIDIAVTCQPPALEMASPILVVEIMSAESASHDLGRKLPDYTAIASVQEAWMVHSERRWVQLWCRDDARWMVRVFTGSEVFRSVFLDASIELDQLYDMSGR